MRVTQQTMIGNMLKNLHRNYSIMDELNQQLSTGKEFQKASQAPIKVANSMQFNSLIQNNEQYKRNVQQSINWLNSSETSLDNANSILQRIRELAVYGATGSLTQSDRDSIASEVKELRNELINIANNKLGDRFLFAGQATSTKPFDDDGNYQGDFNNIQREINPSVKITINIIGEYAFRDAIDAVDSLYNNITSGNITAISNSDIAQIDNAINITLTYRSEIGAKINRLELTESRLDDEIINIKRLLSQNEDIDIAETITEMKTQESIYRAALAVGARIIQPSLIDFIR